MTTRMSIVPLGDEAMLVRFADSPLAEAKPTGSRLCSPACQSPPVDVLEIVAESLVSVQRLRPGTDFRLAGELSLMSRDAGP